MSEGDKRPMGRPSKHGRPMKDSERAAASRARLRAEIEAGDPARWSERACCEVITRKKYASCKEAAWRRLGEINGFEQ